MRSAQIVLTLVVVACAAVGAQPPSTQPPSASQSADKAKERAVTEVLKALGEAAKFSGGECPDPRRMVDIYLEEIGRRPSVSLGETVPAFAKRAAALCPKSRPTITPGNQVDVSRVAEILGLANPPQEGTIALESWLELTVVDGKVVTLTIVLEKTPR